MDSRYIASEINTAYYMYRISLSYVANLCISDMAIHLY